MGQKERKNNNNNNNNDALQPPPALRHTPPPLLPNSPHHLHRAFHQCTHHQTSTLTLCLHFHSYTTTIAHVSTGCTSMSSLFTQTSHSTAINSISQNKPTKTTSMSLILPNRSSTPPPFLLYTSPSQRERPLVRVLHQTAHHLLGVPGIQVQEVPVPGKLVVRHPRQAARHVLL